MWKEQRPEQDRGDHGHGVRFEEVGRHARAVTDVVADVVRNDCGVARIVLGDAGLDFAHKVRADVSRLGVDPTTQPGEHRNEARAEGQAHQNIGILEDQVRGGHSQQAEANHHETGDGAAAERDLQRFVQAATGSFGGAHVRPHGDVHADVSGGG